MTRFFNNVNGASQDSIEQASKVLEQTVGSAQQTTVPPKRVGNFSTVKNPVDTEKAQLRSELNSTKAQLEQADQIIDDLARKLDLENSIANLRVDIEQAIDVEIAAQSKLNEIRALLRECESAHSRAQDLVESYNQDLAAMKTELEECNSRIHDEFEVAH